MDDPSTSFHTTADAQRTHYDRKVEKLLYSDRTRIQEVPFKYFSAYQYVFQEMGNVSGKKLLDFGCGEGDWVIHFAAKGAHVSAFDISPNQVELTQRKARAEGLASVEVKVMNAEQLHYPDNTFDFVFGNGVLHHLTKIQTEGALIETARVLKPEGKAFFIEAIANSKILRWLTGKLTSNDFTVDRPLTSKFLIEGGRVFNSFKLQEFRVFSRAERFFQSQEVRAFICRADNSIISRLRFLQRLGSVAVVTYMKGGC